jgi:hypothetical protein
MRTPGFELRHDLVPGLEAEVVQKLMGRLKVAGFMEMPEDEFRRLVKDIESDPLFKRFCYSSCGEDKVIGFRRFGGTSLSSHCLELKEEIADAPASVDIETLLEGHPEESRLITRLGMDTFKRYFLYTDENLSIPEIAARCGIAPEQAQQVVELVNTVLLHQEIGVPARRNAPETGATWSRVASIERGSEGFVIAFFVPSYARGRYQIDYEKLRHLKEVGQLQPREARSFESLVRKMELVNSRRHLLYRILEKIVEVQQPYLKSGDVRDLCPFLLKDAAAQIGVDLSLVSRVIQNRSVETPWGEKSIRFLFPNHKEFKKQLVREIIERETASYSDETIRRIMLERYRMKVSRRAVALYRQMLEIDSSYARRGVDNNA